MGQHYVPQRHLRNFQIVGEPGLIWMFDKESRKSSRASIAKVAQEHGFYTEEMEATLAHGIELPGGNAIDKLVRGEGLKDQERLHLTLHIATMLTRVPHRRKKAHGLIPAVIEQTKHGLPETLDELTVHRSLTVLEKDREIAEANQTLESFRTDLPQEIADYIRDPRPTEDMVEAIYRMTWRVLTPPRSDFFITSDNPAVFHEYYGLFDPSAEIVFPLSPRCVLHGCCNPGLSNLGFLRVKSTIVQEVNRRIAHGVTRFAFCHEKADWIIRLIQKSSHNLKHIRFDQ